MSTENRQLTAGEVVRAFFSSLDESYEAMHRGYTEWLADDCVWENSGFPTMRGKAECIAGGVESFAPGVSPNPCAGLRVEMLHLMEEGDTVLTERLDYVLGVDGEVALTIPVCGRLTVRDGKIATWADYFDPGVWGTFQTT